MLPSELFLKAAERVSLLARHVKHVNPDKSGLGTPSALWQGIAVHVEPTTPYSAGDKTKIGLISGDDLRCIWIGTASKYKNGGVVLTEHIQNPEQAMEYIVATLDAHPK